MRAWVGSLGCVGAAAGLLFAGVACAQAPVGREPAVAPSYSVERSAVLAVSGPGEESYSIMVAWPAGDPPPSGWPVLYVLDGEDNFAIFALTARRLAKAGRRSGIAPGVVVGIGAGPLPRRVRDYTPPVPGYHIPAGRPAAGMSTGGSEAFLDLLEKRVMPLVRQRWRIDAARETLAGHSFGGLLAIHALLTRPALLDRVVAVSPSFWFGDGFPAREAATAAGPRRGGLLIVTGGQEQGAADAADAFIAALPRGSLDHVRHVDLPGQSHGGTMLAAASETIGEAFGTERP